MTPRLVGQTDLKIKGIARATCPGQNTVVPGGRRSPPKCEPLTIDKQSFFKAFSAFLPEPERHVPIDPSADRRDGHAQNLLFPRQISLFLVKATCMV